MPMKIQQLDLTVRDLAAGCHDDGDGGLVGYGGKLDIRPPITARGNLEV